MRLPIATTIQSRDGTLAKDSKLVNAIVEQVGDALEVYRRPGTTLYSSAPAGTPQGVFCMNGLHFAAGNSLSDFINTVSSVTLTQGSLLPASATWQSVAYGNGVWVAIPRFNTTTTAAYSTDGGATWGSATIADAGGDRYGVAWNGSVFCSLTTATGTLVKSYISTDGTSWSLGGTLTPSAATVAITGGHRCITVINGVFYAVAAYTAGAVAVLFSSSDGITWTEVSRTAIAYSGNLQIVYGNGKLIVYSDNTNASTYLLSTNNGSSFTAYTIPQGGTNYINCIAFDGNDTFVAVGNESALTTTYTTTDGINWTSGSITTGTYYATSAYDGIFVAFRNSTTGLLTSPDGLTWTTTTINSGNWIGSATDGAGTFISVGYGSQLVCKAVIATTPGIGNTFSLSGAGGLPISSSITSGSAATEKKFFKTAYKAWTLTGTTLTQVTDADYPATTVPGVVYLDGYFFVMDQNGTIYNSDLENPSSWNALNFIKAEIEPEDGIAIAKHQNYVVAFKETTTELFYNAANASGSPLARLSNAAIQIGCATGYSIASLEGGTFFLSRSKSKQISAYYFPVDGIQPVEVATPAVQRVLTASDVTNAKCWAGRIGGHSFFVITLPTEGITIGYDLQSRTWSQWTWLTANASKSVSSLTQADGIATATCTAHGLADGDPVVIAGATPSGYNGTFNVTYVDANTFTFPVSSSLSTPATGTITAVGYTAGYFPFSFFVSCGQKDFIQHTTTGDVYEISFELSTDNGVPIDVLIRSPKFDGGSLERKTMNRVGIVGDQVSGNLLARYTDDDYQTFSKYRQVSLAQENPQIRRLGMFRRRAMDFRFTDSGNLHLTAVDLEIGG